MEIALPIPREFLAQRMGISSRALDNYLAKLKIQSPEVFALYQSLGTYKGFTRRIKLYDLRLIPYLEHFLPVKIEPQVKKEPEKPSPKQKTVTEPKKPPISPDKILNSQDEEYEEPEHPEQKSAFFQNTINWSSVFQILEAGATVEETAGLLRIDQQVMVKRCYDTFGITFTALRNYCFYSGNAKIKMALYASAIGTKERRPNPLIQLMMGKDRIMLGTSDMEKPSNIMDVVSVEGKEYDMNEIPGSEFERIRILLTEQSEKIDDGKSLRRIKQNGTVSRKEADEGASGEDQPDPVAE